MLQSTAPVVLKVLLCTTKYYSVLQTSIPVLLCTTLYYKVLLQYYPVVEVLLQYYSAATKCYSSTTPVQKKLPKWSFRARLPPNFTEKTSKTSVSCEASDKFHRKRFQNDRFVRGFIEISQKKVPKRAFRARLPPNFTRKNFHNERFVRSFRQFSQKEVPKWSFRARLHRNFTKEGSKTSVSREASSKFHRTSFQNERFARGFRQFHRKNFQKDRFARCFRQFSLEKNFQKDRKLKMEKNSPKKWKKNPRKVLDPEN